MTIVRLEYCNDKSRKFWEIRVEGNSHTVRYGKIGANGTSTTKSFSSNKEAQASADKLIAAKQKKGYELCETSQSPESADAPLLDKLATDFGLDVPERYRRFVVEQVASHVNLIPPVPTYAKFRLEFVTAPDLGDLLELIDSGERYDSTGWKQAYPGWFPMATLSWEDHDTELEASSSAGREFFCIDANVPECPVYLYEAAGAPTKVSETLDAFVASLVAQREQEIDHKQLVKRTAALQKSFAERDFDSCVKDGAALLRVADPRFMTEVQNIRHCLGWSYAKTGEFEKGKACFGSTHVEQLQVALIEAYEQDNYEGALTRLKELDESTAGNQQDAELVVPKTMGYCYFRSGATQAAEAQYRRIHRSYLNRDKAELQETIEELQRLEFLDVLEWFGKLAKVEVSQERAKELTQQWAVLLDQDREWARALANLFSFDLEQPTLDELGRMYATEVLNFETKGRASRIPSLASFDQLTQLKWISSSIGDLEGVQQAALLTHLNLGHSHVKDLAPLKECSALRVLDLRDNAVVSLRPLKNLHALEELYLHKNRVESLRGIEKLPGLQRLGLGQNAISSVEIYELNELVELDLSRNRIGDFINNNGLSKLETLDVSDNFIDDVSCFGAMPALKELDISGNCFDDITDLAKLEALEELQCESSKKIKGIAALAGLKNLRTVSSDGMFIPKELKAFRKLRPDVDID